MVEKNVKINKSFNSSKKKLNSKNLSHCLIYITSTHNNVIVTITDLLGNTIKAISCGRSFKGAQKSTPFAVQSISETIIKSLPVTPKTIDVIFRGINSIRESALRTFLSLGIQVLSITEATFVPHNGCRPPKRRRN